MILSNVMNAYVSSWLVGWGMKTNSRVKSLWSFFVKFLTSLLILWYNFVYETSSWWNLWNFVCKTSLFILTIWWACRVPPSCHLPLFANVDCVYTLENFEHIFDIYFVILQLYRLCPSCFAPSHSLFHPPAFPHIRIISSAHALGGWRLKSIGTLQLPPPTTT